MIKKKTVTNTDLKSKNVWNLTQNFAIMQKNRFRKRKFI